VHVVAARQGGAGGASAVRSVLVATGGGCEAAAGLDVEPAKQGDAWITRCGVLPGLQRGVAIGQMSGLNCSRTLGS